MTRLPRISGRRMISLFHRAGFVVVRINGSHHFLRHPDGRCTVVPVHAGETLGPGIINKILHDCDLPREEFIRLL